MVNKSEILKWFMLNFPRICEAMRQSDHNYSDKILNNYHIEGSVFTHTMMVFSHVKPLYISTVLAALLHDIGKPFAREENHEKQRVSFYGHDGLSAFYSLDILYQYERDFNVKLDIPMIFTLIGLHTQPFKNTPEKMADILTGNINMAWKLRSLNIADNKGRFGDTDESNSGYALKTCYKTPSESVKELVLMMGLPNSGKSSRIKSEYSDYHIVSRDDVIVEMYPSKDYNTAYLKADHKEVNKELDKRLDSATKYDKVVIDMVNMSKKRRGKILNRFKNHKKICDMMLTSMVAIQNRNKLRVGKIIPMEAYMSMMKAFLPPTYDQFDEINYILE